MPGTSARRFEMTHKLQWVLLSGLLLCAGMLSARPAEAMRLFGTAFTTRCGAPPAPRTGSSRAGGLPRLAEHAACARAQAGIGGGSDRAALAPRPGRIPRG